MTDFKAKMHQIRFWLGLRPDPAGGAYSVPPDPLAGFGGLLLRRGKGKGGEGGREEREREEREGVAKERAMSPPPTIWRKFTPMHTVPTMLQQDSRQ